MTTRQISREKLGELLHEWSRGAEVYAPVTRDSNVVFERVEGLDPVALQCVNAKKVPKEFFFPQSEKLLAYRQKERQFELVEEKEEERKKILFGVRPCDARSFAILDKLFVNEDYVDDFYKRKRENATVIGLACNSPCTTCFCTSLGSGPFATEGLDLFAIHLGEVFLFEEISEKGKKLVSKLKEATQKQIEQKEALRKKAEKRLGPPLDLKNLPEKLKDMFEHPLWEELAKKCLGCGICTYTCPTCHCFDIQDEVLFKEGKRIKNWDSCMFPLFTYHGSGHQPRDKHFQRVRQRILHKFSYFFENFGDIACVGCGRCIRYCPVNVDIRKNLEALRDAAPVPAEK